MRTGKPSVSDEIAPRQVYVLRQARMIPFMFPQHENCAPHDWRSWSGMPLRACADRCRQQAGTAEVDTESVSAGFDSCRV
jgi:hypothetical protein